MSGDLIRSGACPSPEVARVKRLLDLILKAGLAAPLKAAHFKRKRRVFHRERQGYYELVTMTMPWHNAADKREFQIDLHFDVPFHTEIYFGQGCNSPWPGPNPSQILNGTLSLPSSDFAPRSYTIDTSVRDVRAQEIAAEIAQRIEAKALPWFATVHCVADLAAAAERPPESKLTWSAAYHRELGNKLKSAAILRYLDGDDARCETNLARLLAECHRSMFYDDLKSFAARLRAMMAARTGSRSGSMP